MFAAARVQHMVSFPGSDGRKRAGCVPALCGAVLAGCTLLFACTYPGTSRVAQSQGVQVVLRPGPGRGFDSVSWSPDGERLAIGGWGLDSRFVVYTASLSTGMLTELSLDGQPLAGVNPSWSPKGNALAVLELGGVRVVRWNGALESQLLLPRAGNAAWSPDGQRIAVLSTDTQTVTLQAFDLRGDELAHLYDLSGPDLDELGDVAWSPLGDRVAFTLRWRSGADRQGDLYVITLRDRRVTRLTDTPLVDEVSPTWSPDGSRLAFVSLPLEHRTEGHLTLIDVDTQCTKTIASPVGFERVSWSPGGNQIAVVSEGKVFVFAWSSIDVSARMASSLCR